MSQFSKLMSARQNLTPSESKGFTTRDEETAKAASLCRCGNCFACKYNKFASKVRQLTNNQRRKGLGLN